MGELTEAQGVVATSLDDGRTWETTLIDVPGSSFVCVVGRGRGRSRIRNRMNMLGLQHQPAPPRSAIAASIAEATTAVDTAAIVSAVFDGLIDDPAFAQETVRRLSRRDHGRGGKRQRYR